MSDPLSLGTAASGPRPVLVLGTGRCGSTLVSEMIRDHPDALSLSELFSFVTDFGMRIERAFPNEMIDGARFWGLLSEPLPRQSILLRHGLQMGEVIYPWDVGRFTPEGGLAPILQGLVPHLAPGDPDRLFDELEVAMSGRPTSLVGDHYRALFTYLQDRFAKRLWVERSGGSLRAADRLMGTFPEARILHLVRDGRDTALSMSRHIGFRMAMVCAAQAELLGVDPFDDDDRSEEEDLSAELAALLPERFTNAAFGAFELHPALCGHYWSGEIIAGLGALSFLGTDDLLTVRYEDLLASPCETVDTIGRFLGDAVCPRWIERAAGRVELRGSRWPELPQQDQDQLEEACRPGFEALAQYGLTWS